MVRLHSCSCILVGAALRASVHTWQNIRGATSTTANLRGCMFYVHVCANGVAAKGDQNEQRGAYGDPCSSFCGLVALLQLDQRCHTLPLFCCLCNVCPQRPCTTVDYSCKSIYPHRAGVALRCFVRLKTSWPSSPLPQPPTPPL